MGSFTINVGATLQFGTGTHTIFGSTTDNGKLQVTDGTLEIAGAISGIGSLQIDTGATLQLDGADLLNVTFTGSTGTLILKDPGNFSGTISGLTGSDQIDLANINPQAAQVSSASYSPTTNVTTLVITDGQHISTILLVGDYTGSTWTFSSDGSGGTIVVDPVKTVVALSVTDSTGVVDTTTSSSDLTRSSSSTAVDDATTGDVSNVATTETLIFSVAGLDLLSEHIWFEDTDGHSRAAVGAFDNDSNSSAHSGLLWLADFLHGEPNYSFATLLPPDLALNLQSAFGSQYTKSGVLHVELENSYGGGKNLSFIDPSGQVLPHIWSTVAADNPNDHVAQPSLPMSAAAAPQFDHDASPPADHPRTDLDQHFDDVPRQTKAHPSEILAVDPDDHGFGTRPTAAFDKQASEHNDAAITDPDPGHVGWTRHGDDLSSQPAGHKLSDTSEHDKPAFDLKDAPSRSVEYKVSNASEDGGPDHPHPPLSPIATATLPDAVTPPAAHSPHAHGGSPRGKLTTTA